MCAPAIWYSGFGGAWGALAKNRATLVSVFLILTVVGGLVSTFTVASAFYIVYKGFPTFVPSDPADVITAYEALAAAHSTQASNVSIGTTVNGHEIECFTFGNGSGKVLIVSTLHGWEIQSATAYLKAFTWMFSDSAGQDCLNRTTYKIVPIANYDEYGIKRQNKNGVDLNRNFVYDWASGVSTDPRYYHGTSAASEPETQAVRSLLASFLPNLFIDTHNGGANPLYTHGEIRRLSDMNSTHTAEFYSWIDAYKANSTTKSQDIMANTTTSGGGFAAEDAYQNYNATSCIIETYDGEESQSIIPDSYVGRTACLLLSASAVFGVSPYFSINFP